MRHVTTLSLFIIAILVFAGCQSTDKEYGEVPMTEYTQDETEDYTIFTPQDEPFGYSYKTYKNGRAEFQIPYPSTWQTQNVSDQHLTIVTPADDPYLRDVTIHIVTNHDSFYDEPSAQNAMTIFQTTLPTLPIIVGGKSLTKLPYDFPDVVDSLEHIIKNEPEILSYTLDKDLKTLKNLSEQYTGGPTLFNYCYYINWPIRPTLVFVTGQTEQIKDVKLLTDYMISNIKEYKDTTITSKSTLVTSGEDLYDVNFYLPGEWQPASANATKPFDSVIRYVVNDSSSPYSGMTANISIIENPVDLSKTSIEEIYMETLSINMIQERARSSDFRSIYYTEPLDAEPLIGKDIKAHMARTTMLKMNAGVATNLPDTMVTISLLFIFERDKDTIMITLSCYESQEKLMVDVVDIFSRTLSLNK